MPLGPETGRERSGGGNVLVARAAGHAILEPAHGSPHSASGVPEVRCFATATSVMLELIAPGHAHVAWCGSPQQARGVGGVGGWNEDFYRWEKRLKKALSPLLSPAMPPPPVGLARGSHISFSTTHGFEPFVAKVFIQPTSSIPHDPQQGSASMIASLPSSSSRPVRALSSLVCGVVIAAISVIVVVIA